MENQTEAELSFPDLLNASCYRHKHPPTQELVISILIWCTSVLTVALNLLVVISISHYRQLHTTTNLLLLSLGVTDLTAGLMLPVWFFLFRSCWTLGPIMCAVVLLLIFTPVSASVGNMVLISVDRYVAICEPLLYHTKVTVRRVQICVGLCWICSVFYNSMFFTVGLGETENACRGERTMPINIALGTLDLLVTFVCPITLIIVLYSRVFVVAVSQARAHRSKTVRSVNISVNRSELKAAMTLGVVMLVFMLCFCPYYCFYFIGQDVFIVTCFMYLSSCLNPLLYALFYPWFRKAVKLIVSLQILQTDSCRTRIL